MATLTLRTTKGSELTWQEADDNFTNLNNDIIALDNGTIAAGVASTVTLTADNTTAATNYPLFSGTATGNVSPKTDTGLTYNPSTGALTSTSFNGALNGAHNGTVGATTPNTILGTSIRATGTTLTGGLGVQGTGTGGQVTQLTSRTTGVTLNTWTGNITLFTTTLAAATSTAFVLTNTLIAATDLVVVQHVSGGTLGLYNVVSTAAAGSATITIRNNSATISASEAPVIKFMVIKATTA